MTEVPRIIKGGIHKDQRGIIRFVNDFRFREVVRFYTIRHPDVDTVRAWQGHRLEAKWFYPLSGSFVIAWVKIDDFENPSDALVPKYHIVSPEKSELVFVPKGYANGLKALEPDSEVLIFSNLDLTASAKDDIRFNPDLWFDWVHLKPLNKKSQK